MMMRIMIVIMTIKKNSRMLFTNRPTGKKQQLDVQALLQWYCLEYSVIKITINNNNHYVYLQYSGSLL